MVSEVLPASVLALFGPVAYVSTACQTAVLLAECEDPRLPIVLAEAGLPHLPGVIAAHHVRCRRTHKFLGTPCACPCHEGER